MLPLLALLLFHLTDFDVGPAGFFFLFPVIYFHSAFGKCTTRHPWNEYVEKQWARMCVCAIQILGFDLVFSLAFTVHIYTLSASSRVPYLRLLLALLNDARQTHTHIRAHGCLTHPKRFTGARNEDERKSLFVRKRFRCLLLSVWVRARVCVCVCVWPGIRAGFYLSMSSNKFDDMLKFICRI